MIVGHSLCARLYSNLTTGTNPRMTSSFSWTVKMDQISFLGRGGKWMAHIKNKDLHKICEVRPDIVAFIIGENDICSNTDPKKLVHHVTINPYVKPCYVLSSCATEKRRRTCEKSWAALKKKNWLIRGLCLFTVYYTTCYTTSHVNSCQRNARWFYIWCDNITHSHIWTSVYTHIDNYSRTNFIRNTNIHWHCIIVVHTIVMHKTQASRQSGTFADEGGRGVPYMPDKKKEEKKSACKLTKQH